MSTRPSYYSSTLNIDPEARVAEELISNRAIWRKAVCILLCLAFVLNAWAAVILHAVNFSNETMLELSISISILLVGQYLGTGLVDVYWYYIRWKRSPPKPHSKQSEQNKETWVCMRITLSLMGLAPISRYIESLLVVGRMLRLEKQYLHEIVTVTKEHEQVGTAPGGSLISGPTMSARQSESTRNGRGPTVDSLSSAAKRNALDSGLTRVYKIRRQFRRTENDAAYVALASGVLGAGPFLISQGVLYFRRVGLNYTMTTPTLIGVLSSCVTGLIWLSASLTHFYPHAYDQSKLDFERGVGQIGPGGLILLYFTHFVHVYLRCATLILFISQFYWVAVIVVGFHFFFVLALLVGARACTSVDYSNTSKVERSSVSKNILSDLLFSYVSLFEFTNAYAKFTRTRYFLYYFFYYLENAAMVGAWYVHFTYSEMRYHLPALLIITVVQFLGFILFQLYLYLFSKSRRKTTLCGLCFRHLDGTEIHLPSTSGSGQPTVASLTSAQGYQPQPSTSRFSTNSRPSNRDPVFGQKFSQSAVPKRKRTSSYHQQLYNQNNKSNPSILSNTTQARKSLAADEEANPRIYRHYHKSVDRLSDEQRQEAATGSAPDRRQPSESHHRRSTVKTDNLKTPVQVHPKGVYQPSATAADRQRWSSVSSRNVRDPMV